MNEPNTTLQIKFYKISVEGEPKKTGDVTDMKWFSKNDDWDTLGPVDKNYLIPALVERGLIK
jgi:hypothetical protein